MSFINAKVVGKGVNPVEYHQQKVDRGDPNFIVSPSTLKEFVKCPRRWMAGYVSPDTLSKAFGSLLDCRLLTPEQFEKRYAIQPETYVADGAKKGDPKVDKPWNNNATVCRAWRTEQREAGKEVISKDDLAECETAIRRLFSDEIVVGWHKACDTQVWVEGSWQDEGTGLFIPVRCLLDYVPRIDSEYARCLGDLKTSASGSLRFFSRNVFTLGYHIQAAFDLALYNAATAEDRSEWCFIGLENFEPWEPFRRMLHPEYISMGQQAFELAIRYYCRCLKRNEWPGYDDNEDAVQGWSIAAPEPWMQFEMDSQKMREAVGEELTTDQKIEMAGL